MEEQKRGRGQPPFAPTKRQRHEVEVWAAGGLSEESIAHAIGISRTTLRKHFAQELDVGADKKRGEVVAALFAAAKSGNVAAQKAFLARSDVSAAQSKFGGKPEKPVRQRPAGKKEVADEAAKRASAGRFAPPAPPKLVVNND